MEYINWKSSNYKDLTFVNKDITNLFIIDDMERYILPEQKNQWIEIRSFERPYKKDKELKRIMNLIK